MIDEEKAADAVDDTETARTSLSDGQVEELVQVDRRRLEAMITGEPLYGSEKHLPAAPDFFVKVAELSGAFISWPSRLKIGAKTKKDPFVKLLGTPDQVNCARQLITSMLKIKHDRITLKIEIPHTEHSKIIGRKGRNTQEIMRKTMCHIHFPDSNKNHDLEKNNQVSISGSVGQVEKARLWLRSLSPVSVSFELLNTCRYPLQEVQRSVATSGLFVTFRENFNNSVSCTLKGIQQHEVHMVRAVIAIANMFNINSDTQIACRTMVTARSSQRGGMEEEHGEQLRWLSLHTATSVQPSEPGALLIMGPIAGVLVARKYIIGLMPVALQFDRVVESEYDLVDKSAVEAEFGLTMSEKWKKNQNSNSVSLVVLLGSECNVSRLYQARNRILNVVQNTCDSQPDSSDLLTGNDLQTAVEALRSEAKQSFACAGDASSGRESPFTSRLQQLFQSASSSREDDSRLADALVDVPNVELHSTTPVMPDPDNSPIAHSLLTSAKRIEQKRNEQEKVQTREQLLLKANRAIYDASPAQVRYPTDIWAGYGFSNSLPADVMKAGLGFFESASPAPYETLPLLTHDSKGNDSAMLGPMTPSGGLCSLLEEDEQGASGNQDSSNSNSLLSSSSFHNLQHLQQSVASQPPISRRAKRDFSASTSIFESSPYIGSDCVWDIRVFVDPAMVLAQIGCSEYLAHFRDQEIDMEAFLLLDEQNLKDIGVSTMGARKKLYNAIIKLRESARMHGVRL